MHLAFILSTAQSRTLHLPARPVRLVASIEIVAGHSVWGCWSELRLIAIAFASTVMTKHCEVIVCRLLDNSIKMPRLVPAIRPNVWPTAIAKALGIGRASVYRVLEAVH